MSTLTRQRGTFLACAVLLSGCASWQSQLLRGTHLYPASAAQQQLVGIYSVFSKDEYPVILGGPVLELLSDGSYYEKFFHDETGQSFIVDNGHWQSQDGHLHLESNHRVVGMGHPRTEPDYAVASTSRREVAGLRLLPASLGSFQEGQLILQDQPAKGNFLSDKEKGQADIFYQIESKYQDEPQEEKKLEQELREGNDAAKHRL